MIPTEEIRVYADGLDHPEGVTWGPDGRAYAGGEAGQVYRIEGEPPAPVELGSSGGFTLGVACDGDGNVFTCDPVARAVQVFSPDGACRRYADGSPDEPIVAPNHLAFDARGNLYASDCGRWKAHDGRIYRVRPGGEAEIWCRSLTTLPNGVCVGPGEEHLYVAMTLAPPRIARVEIRADGSAGRVEDVCPMPGTLPDGLAFDEAGDLYVVTYRPDAVYRLRAGSSEAEPYATDPEGTLLAAPTNLAFGEIAGEPRLLAANIGRWHLSHLPVRRPGLPLAYPKGVARAG